MISTRRNMWLVVTILLAASSCPMEAHDAKDFDDNILYKIDFEAPEFEDFEFVRKQLKTFLTYDKEKYECVIPKLEEEKEEAKTNKHESSPMELLNPFFTATSCSYRIEAYWSYEICHGQYVRQYHEERDGKNIKFQEYYLGQFNDEMKEKVVESWRESQKAGIKYKTTKIENTKYPYFEVEMTGGTMCDIIEAPRTTVVRYICYPHGKNEIYSFKETSSCNYEAIILTSALCMIPAFHAEESKEISIKCFNSLTDPHKPLSMLRRELLEYDMAIDDLPVIKEAAPVAAGIQSSEDRYVFVNKFGGEVDKLVKELMSVSGIEVNADGFLTQEVPKLNPSDMLGNKKPNRDSMQPIRDFISGTNCLTGGNGWWKYEFCYGRYVRQFHKDKKTDIELYLGHFSPDSHRQWIKENPSKGPKRPGFQSSVWHHYDKGSRCDKTGMQREVDVKLTCAAATNSATAVSMYMLEPKTCQYILVVESPVICTLISLADENGLVDEASIQAKLARDQEEKDDKTPKIRTVSVHVAEDSERPRLRPYGIGGNTIVGEEDVHV